HRAKYNKWARTNNFESKLPKALKAKREKAEDAVARVEQGTLNNHLKEMPKTEQAVLFTNASFHNAAIEWLIITDRALSHPSFKNMMDIGAHCQDGILGINIVY
ncbi:hypothetical protein JB92DRAFT_2776448, partial [Gautieria morchelliformis]